MTKEEILAIVDTSKTLEEWHANVNKIKNQGMYPPCWYPEFIATGYVKRKLASFGESDELRLEEPPLGRLNLDIKPTPKLMTKEQIKTLLDSSTNLDEWNANLVKIQYKGMYPIYWYDEFIATGYVRQKEASFGKLPCT